MSKTMVFFLGKKLGLYTEGPVSLCGIGYLRLSFDVYYKSLEANQVCVALQHQFLVSHLPTAHSRTVLII